MALEGTESEDHHPISCVNITSCLANQRSQSEKNNNSRTEINRVIDYQAGPPFFCSDTLLSACLQLNCFCLLVPLCRLCTYH